MTNFFEETNNAFTPSNETVESTTETKPVILRFGTEEVEVLEDTSNTTISVLVQRYQEELGIDAARITSYRYSGQIVSGSDTATPGAVYSLGISAESKGI